jgi:hypothetical protein
MLNISHNPPCAEEGRESLDMSWFIFEGREKAKKAKKW